MIWYLLGVTVGLSPDISRYFKEGNLANYENSEISGILNELYSITDEKILKEKYKRLQEFYEEDRPYIGLYYNRITIITRKELNSFWLK